MTTDRPVPPSIPPRNKPGSPGAARPSTARPTIVRPAQDVPAQAEPVSNPGSLAAKLGAPPTSTPTPTPTPGASTAATPIVSSAPASKVTAPREPASKVTAPKEPVAPVTASTVAPLASPRVTISPLAAPKATAPRATVPVPPELPTTTASPAAPAGNEEPAHESTQGPTRAPVSSSVLRALKSATATVAGATAAVAGSSLRATKSPTSANGIPPRSESTKADPTIAANETHAAAAVPRTSARPAASPEAKATPDGARLPAPAAARDGAARRVRLSVSRVDPWSVMKLAFLLSVAIGIMIVVASGVVWFVLDGLAVFTTVDDMVTEVAGTESNLDVLKYVQFSRVLSGATMIAVVDVILLTALATIGAFLYNITAALVGGVTLTLTDD